MIKLNPVYIKEDNKTFYVAYRICNGPYAHLKMISMTKNSGLLFEVHGIAKFLLENVTDVSYMEIFERNPDSSNKKTFIYNRGKDNKWIFDGRHDVTFLLTCVSSDNCRWVDA